MEVALRYGQMSFACRFFRKVTNLQDQAYSTVMGPEAVLLGEDTR